MKFVEVEKVPGQRTNHRLKDKWDEFMAMNIKVAKIELDENDYKSITTAKSVMAVSIKRYGYPITITRRGNDLYLVRRDM